MFSYIQYIRNSVARHAFEEVDVMPSKNLNEEWYQLSWLKDEFGEPLSPNPVRVIGLAQKMTHDMDPFRGAVHMTSSFYSQVKHLLKMKRAPAAIAFYLESRSWAAVALERANHKGAKFAPIDLEVLGAPDFLLAVKLPLIGKLYFKEKALAFLSRASQEWTSQTIARGQGYKANLDEKLVAALIWSKLFVLTGHPKYKTWVLENADMKNQLDLHQVLRIAQHLGFKTKEELYEACSN